MVSSHKETDHPRSSLILSSCRFRNVPNLSSPADCALIHFVPLREPHIHGAHFSIDDERDHWTLATAASLVRMWVWVAVDLKVSKIIAAIFICTPAREPKITVSCDSMSDHAPETRPI